MSPRLLDRIALLAMILYLMGALSYYLPFFLGSGAYTPFTMQCFFLLPSVFAGAGVYGLLRYRNESGFTPRWLAAAALGSGAATLLAWESFHLVLVRHNRAHPPTDFSGPDVDPAFGLVFPYMLLCGLLSVGAALALPKLVWIMLRDLRTPVHSE